MIMSSKMMCMIVTGMRLYYEMVSRKLSVQFVKMTIQEKWVWARSSL